MMCFFSGICLVTQLGLWGDAIQQNGLVWSQFSSTEDFVLRKTSSQVSLLCLMSCLD